MGFFSNLFSSSASTLVDSVGKAIDDNVTSDEERLQLRNALTTIKEDALIKAKELELEADKEITKRWTSDNEHLITRLVRPVAYGWILILFSALVLTDGNFGEFTIREAYIPVIETLMLVMTGAYFASRGLEKINKLRKKDS